MSSLCTLVVLLLMCCLPSCRNDIIKDDSPEEVFLTFWETLDRNYPFFREKGMDWDSVYTTCYPLARSAASDVELAEVFSAIIQRLQDRHVAISGFRKDTDVALRIYPRVRADTLDIGRGGMDKKYGLVPRFDAVITHPFWFYEDTIKKQAFVAIESFLDRDFEEYGIKPADFISFLNRLDYRNGLIIDLRNNGGGNAAIMMEIASSFFYGEKVMFYEINKVGNGHDDFGEAKPVKVTGKGDIPGSVPIVVLTGPCTYSAGNFFAFILTDLPNCTLVGERTGGGGGAIHDILLPNDWVLSYPYNKIFSSQGANMEYGVEPDIFVEQRNEYNRPDVADQMILRAKEVLDGISGDQ